MLSFGRQGRKNCWAYWKLYCVFKAKRTLNFISFKRDSKMITSSKMGVVRINLLCSWRMVFSGMLRRVALVRTDVSEEPSASFIRVTRIGELGTTLAATSNRHTLRRNTNGIKMVLKYFGWNKHLFCINQNFANLSKLVYKLCSQNCE
jgi:hypothetical protein